MLGNNQSLIVPFGYGALTGVGSTVPIFSLPTQGVCLLVQVDADGVFIPEEVTTVPDLEISHSTDTNWGFKLAGDLPNNFGRMALHWSGQHVCPLGGQVRVSQTVTLAAAWQRVLMTFFISVPG